MIQTQYASFNGTPYNFKASDPIMGNVSHFSQPLFISIATGLVEITLQQMMTKNALGQMEPISSDMQMNAEGQVEMVYPSEKVTLTLEPGSLIEIRPGCAYALNPLTDGALIQYLLPYPFESPLFGTAIGQIETRPVDDSIHFELVKNKASTTTVQVSPSQPSPEVPSEPIEHIESTAFIQPSTPAALENSTPITPILNVSDLKQQRHFYREPSNAMMSIGLFFTMPFILLIFLVNMWNPIVAILWFMLTSISGYTCFLHALPHFKNIPTLSIEPDGLIIYNRTYQNLKLEWSKILQVRLDARTTAYESAELILIIDVVDQNACIPCLNILQRMWLKQLQINDPSLLAPAVKITATDVDMELNELKALIDSIRK